MVRLGSHGCLLLVALVMACRSGGASSTMEDSVCGDAAARLGTRVCVHAVVDEEAWSSLVVPAGPGDVVAATKYLVPAHEDARLPALIMDAHAYAMHYDFLLAAFPDSFSGMTHGQYLELVLDSDAREFYGGVLLEMVAADGATRYAFTVWEETADPSPSLSREEITSVQTTLDAMLAFSPLGWLPDGPRQRALRATWDDAPFAILSGAPSTDYEAYTLADGYGTVRILTVAGLEQAVEDGALGHQDIVVLDVAPTDLETIVAGIVTGTRQGPLSHLSLRSAARGTPNCYVADAHEAFAPWEGQLVQLTSGVDGYTVAPSDLETASAWWEALRPEPVLLPAADLEWTEVVPLGQVPTQTPDERSLAVRRFGAKGASLATLYGRIDQALTMPGFVVPVSAYQAFVEGNTWTTDFGEEAVTHTLHEGIGIMLADPAFLGDTKVRLERLASLRDAMRTGATVDPAMVATIGGLAEQLMGSPSAMMRFRSSSNAEDALAFSGAGLYDSTSGCLMDSLDEDDEGPSHCDPAQPEERTVERALAKVWASLWTARAYEERSWYGIDHETAVMGVLVNPRTAGEQANAVAFTGHPTAPGDMRYLVTAQVGEASVVLPEPGVTPETSLLGHEEGVVTHITRVTASSLMPVGAWVLSDEQLDELGGLLSTIEASFPVDALAPDGRLILLDMEWKLRSDGTWLVKQVRPFLK